MARPASLFSRILKHVVATGVLSSTRVCPPTSFRRRIAQIPVSTAIAAVIAATAGFALTFLGEPSLAGRIEFTGFFVLVALLGLGVYWWTLQAVDILGSWWFAHRPSR